MTFSRLAPLSVALASLAFAAFASATAGLPDPSFAGSGATTLNFGEVKDSAGTRPSIDRASSTAIQADGKTVVAGSTNVGAATWTSPSPASTPTEVSTPPLGSKGGW